MILPSSQAISFALVVFAILCWSLWPITFKMARERRFELYSFDFAIGTVLASLAIVFTWGTLGFDGFSFLDDLQNASKKRDLAVLAAGAVFNLGNMLLLAGIAECGLAVAVPVAWGVGLAVAAAAAFLLQPGGGMVLLSAGTMMTLCAVGIVAAAYRIFLMARVDELVRTGQRKSTRRKVSMRGPWIAAVGGVLLGCYTPISAWAIGGDSGVGPYAAAFLFAAGVAASTFLFNLFFMNLPISGGPLEILEYFQGPVSRHLPGVAGGAVWCAGFAAIFVATFGDAAVNAGAARSLTAFALVVAALFGITFFHEFARADLRVRAMLFIAGALFVCGICSLALAPASAR